MRILILILLACLVLQPAIQAQKVVVVVDAGHGGKDPGRLKSGPGLLDEKDIVLNIASMFGRYIEKNLSNVEVIYTRKTDVFVSLERRVEIANTRKADYFISIHADSHSDPSIQGTRVHLHSKHNHTAYSLAKRIDNELHSKAKRYSRGIMDSHDRGHSYYVLEHTEMSAILVECGFMTNPGEEQYLNSTYGQEIIASAIYRALRDHLKDTGVPAVAHKERSDELVYKVQICASVAKEDMRRFNSLGIPVEEHIYSDEVYKYKYLVGSESSFAKAEVLRKKVAAKGFTDAFVIPAKK